MGSYYEKLSRIEFKNGNVPQALNLNKKAIELLKEPKNNRVADDFLRAVLFRIRLIPDSMIHTSPLIIPSLELVKELISEWGNDINDLTYVKAQLAYRRESYEEAIVIWKEMLERDSEKGLSMLLKQDVFEGIASSFMSLSRFDSAEVYVKKALDLHNTSEFTLDDLSSLSLDHFKRSADLVPLLAGLGLVQYGFSKRLNNDSLLRVAFNTYQMGEIASQNHRYSLSGKISQLEVSKNTHSLFTGTIRTALDLYASTDSSQYLNLAFSSAEQAKGQTMLQAQWEAEATGQGYLPQRLHEKRRDLLVDLQYVEERIREAEEQRDTLESVRLQNRAFELREDLDQWEADVKRDHPEYHQRIAKNFQVTPSRISKRLLKDGEVLVEYSIVRAEHFGKTPVGEDELFTFILSKDETKVVRSPIPDQFETTIETYLLSLSDYQYIHDSVDASYASYTQSAYQLYQWLMEPVFAVHPDLEKLIIIPDGVLSQLPFEALLTQPANSEQIDYTSQPYLLRRCPVRYGYSAAQLLEVENRSSYSDVEGCLAMAPSGTDGMTTTIRGDFDGLRGPGAKPLPGTIREVQKLVDLGYQGQYLFGDAASEDNFKELAEDFAVLYLAQHGHADLENPVMSFLEFAPALDSSEDGRFHAYELEPLRLKAELVVLSACETGIGKDLPGEGISSLGRQFIAAGAATAITTLWRVDDRASANLMQGFFSNLEKGEASTDALYQAKVGFLNNADSRTSHPYYWASYVANGASRKVPLSKGWGGSIMLAAIVGIIGFGSLLYRRRRRKTVLIAS